MKALWFVLCMALVALGCGDDPDSSVPVVPGSEAGEAGEAGDDDSSIGGEPIPDASVTGGESGESGEEGAESVSDANTFDGEQEEAICEVNEDCGEASSNPCATLECVAGACVEQFAADDTPCSDDEEGGEPVNGNMCVTGSTCQSGQCELDFAENGSACSMVDNSNVVVGECQTTACMDGECNVVPNQDLNGESCDELGGVNLCQVPQCDEGSCVGIALDDGTGCDDGSVCTAGATCESGDCKSAISVPCDDDSLCTLDDVCVDAECLGTDVDCSDDDDCTFDSCDSATGICSYEDDTETPGCPYYDGDGDGIVAKDDNCPEAPNQAQLDWNSDEVGDACAVSACLNSGDIGVLLQSKSDGGGTQGQQSAEDSAVYECTPNCGNTESDCTMGECVADATGLTEDCAGCVAAGLFCRQEQCSDVCVQDGDWELCSGCITEKCDHYSTFCTGLGQLSANGTCPSNTTEFCDGTCWPPGWFDNVKGNGQCDPPLECEAMNMDDGDCQANPEGGEGGMGCDENSVQGCDGGCVEKTNLANGQCDPPLNCSLTGWDGGDCEPTCPTGDTMNCAGECAPLSSIENELSNGSCNGAYECEKFANDGGDCGNAGCGAKEVKDCLGSCVSWSSVMSTYGNGTCDISFGCVDWQKDDADCSGSCLEPADLEIMESESQDSISAKLNPCMQGCQTSSDPGPCTTECLTDAFGTSEPCTLCITSFGQCVFQSCALNCFNPSSEECQDCVEQNCFSNWTDCTGLSF